MKDRILRIFASLIFLVLFNALFFTIGGTEHTAGTWVSYGFIHLAYLCILAVPLYAKYGRGMTVLTYSMYVKPITYFLVELVVGLIIMACSVENPKWPAIIQGVLFALFVLYQVILQITNNSTAASMKKQKEESIFIRTLGDRIKFTLPEITDPEARKHVVRCYDAVNNSSLESFPEAQMAELDMRNAVEMLCSAVDSQNSEQIIIASKKVIRAVQERSAVIKRCRMS